MPHPHGEHSVGQQDKLPYLGFHGMVVDDLTQRLPVSVLPRTTEGGGELVVLNCITHERRGGDGRELNELEMTMQATDSPLTGMPWLCRFDRRAAQYNSHSLPQTLLHNYDQSLGLLPLASQLILSSPPLYAQAVWDGTYL